MEEYYTGPNGLIKGRPEEDEIKAVWLVFRSCSGNKAFIMHDRHGVPIERTRELALEQWKANPDKYFFKLNGIPDVLAKA